MRRLKIRYQKVLGRWQKCRGGSVIGVIIVVLFQIASTFWTESLWMPLNLTSIGVVPTVSKWNTSTRLLLGIDCSDEAWQTSIRDTYIQFYNTTGSLLGYSPSTICPWTAGHISNPLPDCRLFYTFFEISDNCPSDTFQSDSVCLTKSKEGIDISPQVVWLQWASRQLMLSSVSIQWNVGYAEERAMIQPPFVFDILDRQISARNVTPSFATTTSFLDLGECVQETKRYLFCDRVPQARVYWMSPILVPEVLSQLETAGLSNDEDVGKHIHKIIESYLKREQLPPPSVLLNTPSVERSQWEVAWNLLEAMVTKDIPPTPDLLWKHLPCYFVTGKFGPLPETFRSQVLALRAEMLWKFGLRPTHLETYYDFPPWVLNDPTWTQHLAFRSNPRHPSKRGGGFWFWKAPIIRRRLADLLHNAEGENSLLLHADIDLFGYVMEWFPPFLKAFQQGGYDMAVCHMHHKEEQYTTGVVLNEFCGHTKTDTTQLTQYAGGLLLFRNTEASRQFVDDWYTAVKRYDWISGQRDPAFPEAIGFKDHRHDQSFVSTLLQCKFINSTDVYTRSTVLQKHDQTRAMTVHMVRLNRI